MTRQQNWEARNYWKLGPNFGLEVKSPQMGSDGTDIYSFYGITDNGDINVFGLSNATGLFKIYNDRTIEIVGGQNNDGGGIDIVIVGKNGDVTITAEKNGNIRIRGKNITIDGDDNVNIVAGKNVNIKAGSRFVTQTPHADCVAKTGNLAPQGTSAGEQVFPKGSPAGDDVVEETFYAGSPKVGEPAGSPQSGEQAEDDLLSEENTRLTGNETSGSFAPGGAASGGALAE